MLQLPPKETGQGKPISGNHALSIIYRNPADLKLDPDGPRLHSRKQIRQVARSIEAFGFIVPVLTDAQGKQLAAQCLGMTRIPTIMIEHLSESQIRAFMIADNRLTENAAWGEQLLAEQLKTLSELDLNSSVEVTRFEMGEIDVMVEGLAPAHDARKTPPTLRPRYPKISRSAAVVASGQ